MVSHSVPFPAAFSASSLTRRTCCWTAMDIQVKRTIPGTPRRNHFIRRIVIMLLSMCFKNGCRKEDLYSSASYPVIFRRKRGDPSNRQLFHRGQEEEQYFDRRPNPEMTPSHSSGPGPRKRRSRFNLCVVLDWRLRLPC